MTIEPIQRVNFVDQAYKAVKQLILAGELGPGCQLNIDALSRQLGVSNSPIREALRRLEYERWVETIPFRGAFVRPLDEAELLELYEFREIIELAALRKLMRTGTDAHEAAARFLSRTHSSRDSYPAACGKGFPPKDLREGIPARANDSEPVSVKPVKPANREGIPSASGRFAVLRDALGEIEAAVAAGDPLQYLQADARFHQGIVDMAANRRLSDLFRTLVEQGRSFMLGRTPKAMALARGEPDEHAQLLEAIERGDRRKADRLLKAHLRISRDQIRETRENREAADD